MCSNRFARPECKRHARDLIDIALMFRDVRDRPMMHMVRDYAAVAAVGGARSCRPSLGVTCLTCQLVIEGSLVSTSRR